MISIKSDPWVIPSPDLVDTWGEVMPLSPVEINYVEIFLASSSASSDSSVSKTSLDMYSQSPWLGTLEYLDPLVETFLVGEGIMEVMSLEEPPWNDTHHRSSFLPRAVVMSMHLEQFSSQLTIDMSVSPDIVKLFQLRAPLSLHGFRIFLPHRVFTDFPLLQWGCHLTCNPPSPKGNGGNALYEFYSIIWPSRCLLIMSIVKIWCSSVLIDYPSPIMDSLKKFYA